MAFAVLAVLGMLLGLYTGVPWMNKGDGATLRNEFMARQVVVDRDLDRLNHSDDLTRADIRAIWDAINECRTETERLKAYVYPMPSGVSPRRNNSR